MKEWILSIAAEAGATPEHARTLEAFFVCVDRQKNTHEVIQAQAGFELMTPAELFEFYQVLSRLHADAKRAMMWHHDNQITTAS
jgi:hypothetical protein